MSVSKPVMIFAIVLLLALSGSAIASDADSGYVIDSYSVDITVNADNTYNVKERITVDFKEPSHGIYRMLDLRPTMYAVHEELEYTKSYRIKIDNVDADHPFETYRENDLYYVRIGDADKYVNGRVTYNISYRYTVGDDGIADFDQFYFGIIGNEWSTSISNVSFSITMPEAFDAAHIGFSVGRYGYFGYDETLLSYQSDGRTIAGQYAGVLQPREGIWIRLELPEGYYEYKTPAGAVATVVISAVIFVFALVLFLIKRERRVPVATVEFYPPQGLTSADVGFIVDGEADDKDVISLILYWAQHGHIDIEEGEKKSYITFRKISNLPPGANDYETLMFNKFFGSTAETTLSMLRDTSHQTLTDAKKRLKAKYEKPENRLFQPYSRGMVMLLAVLSVLPVAVMIGAAVYQSTFDVPMAVVAALSAALITGYASRVFLKAHKTYISVKRSKKTGAVIKCVLALTAVNAAAIMASIQVFGALSAVAPMCWMVTLFISPYMRVRTDKGMALKGQILGLKNFIEAAEADRLKVMVEDDPEYFYHVLPYAYVLGVSDKWAKRFETIAMPPPHWYYENGNQTAFDTVRYTNAIVRTMTQVQNTITAGSRSSGGGFSGGGSSGGGFSGGGFGGGGGGRW